MCTLLSVFLFFGVFGDDSEGSSSEGSLFRGFPLSYAKKDHMDSATTTEPHRCGREHAARLLGTWGIGTRSTGTTIKRGPRPRTCRTNLGAEKVSWLQVFNPFFFLFQSFFFLLPYKGEFLLPLKQNWKEGEGQIAMNLLSDQSSITL